jgi:hypothetical protein
MAGHGSCSFPGGRQEPSGGRQLGEPNPNPAASIAAPTWNTLMSS